MYTTAIIPAAGFGLRLKNRQSKPLIRIKGVPILIYTLRAISRHPYIKEIIVVANQSNIRAIKYNIKQYRIKKVSDIVLGGTTRRLSVENALTVLKTQVGLILIHDAVRPFIRQDIISKVVDEALSGGAAVVGVPVKATIKKIKIKNLPDTTGKRNSVSVSKGVSRGAAKCGTKSRLIEETIDRNGLYEIQTPQVFKKDLILKAYRKFKDTDVTDDSVLVERLGAQVRLVLGSYDNIKITTREDLAVAQAILSKKI